MKLKAWTRQYIEEVIPIITNKEVSKFLRHEPPKDCTLEDAQKFIAFCEKEVLENQLNLAITYDERIIGGISITRSSQEQGQSENGVLGYWIAEAYWGKGIATQAIKEMCEKAFTTYGITKVVATVFLENKASIRVLEKCGFQYVGMLKDAVYKNNQYYDYVIYLLNKTSTKS